MKILFINSLVETELGGGAEVILWEQIRGLRQKGHKCVLLATGISPGLTLTESDGVRIWRAGIRNFYWPASKADRPAVPLRMAWHAVDGYNALMQGFVRQVVAKEKPDVASLHNLAGWSAATYYTLRTLVLPTVQILHDSYLICVKSSMRNSAGNCDGKCITCRPFRLPHRKLTKNVQAVVGVSRFILNLHVDMNYFAGVPVKKVIYNARDLRITERGDGYNKESMHCELRFGFIGALSPVKGVDALINAFLVADLPDAALWIAGSGKRAYERKLHEAYSDESIVFKGHMTPEAFYPQVDVVIVPSLCHESFGMVIVEALAFGKPVISSRRGGIPEIVRDRYNGLLFEPINSGELVTCLRELYECPSLRTKLSFNAKLSSAPFVDFEGWIDRYEELYGEVASAGISR